MAPITSNIILVKVNTSRWSNTCVNPTPSIIISLAASVTCVNGNINANFCIHGCAPSNENQTPERNIIGQLIKLSIPFATSSFEILAAISRAQQMRQMQPSVNTTNKST